SSGKRDESMNGLRAAWFVLVMVIALVWTGGRLGADTAVPIGEGEVRALEAYPDRVELKGRHAAQQLVVSAMLEGNRRQDRTGVVSYEVADPTIVRVDEGGRVLPRADGTTEIRARYGGRLATVPVTVADVGVDLPINFPNGVVPIFTKLGCNSGGCHGKASGQNGFKLSLLGFEPALDHDSLVKEGRGRRLFVAAPDQSLLLLKATGRLPHGGGKRMDVAGDEYQILRRWVAAGVPYGAPEDPVVTRISVFPEHRVTTRRNAQQIAVTAHYSDGTREDVTRRAQYESNDTEVAGVDDAGRVRTLDLSGEAAVMVRYQGHVAVFRATVPLGATTPSYEFPHQTIVDAFTHRKWRELGLVPSDLATDEPFLRRVFLDLTGTLPNPARVRAFAADADPLKRSRLVDELLETDEYADVFAHKWADILRVRRGTNGADRAYGTFAFHAWIREAVAADLPYDEFVDAILGALGDETRVPSAVWYKDLQSPEQIVDDMAQVFLGLRIACAQCHHHPYETWSQDDYWGLAAFFGRLGRRPVVVPGQLIQNRQAQRQFLFTRSTGTVINKRTGQPAVMKPLDGAPVTVGPDDDPRRALVAWMVRADNPYFARAVVNRYWAHFLGRGIVDPLDDLRQTNPPSNPALLDALAADLVAHRYSLKHLIRTICNSRTYQLGATPNEFNRRDKQSFARFYPKRLGAEVLHDAVAQVLGGSDPFPGLPRDAHAPRRAMALPDESFASYFLDVFGRPQRRSACECERVGEANLAQVLHLLNSEEVQGRLSRPGGRADRLANDPRPDAEKVEELFLGTRARPPTAEQLRAALDYIERNSRTKKLAYEDILWSLINAKDFAFNQ
ncbi:MAG TPA: DUF1549 domain-containing protein, partial [Isosphaeraceae bacterium]